MERVLLRPPQPPRRTKLFLRHVHATVLRSQRYRVLLLQHIRTSWFLSA